MNCRAWHRQLVSILVAALAPLTVMAPAAADTGTGTGTYNAEGGVLPGVFTATAARGYSGSGYMAGFETGGANQSWRFVDNGHGWFAQQNRHSGKVLVVHGTLLLDGGQATQWDDDGTPDHLWRLA